MKIIISSYEELRRWASKKVTNSYNLFILEDVIDEVLEAIKVYSKSLSDKKVICEVEE